MNWIELRSIFIKGFVKTTGGLLALGIGFQLYMLWTKEKEIKKEKILEIDDNFEIEVIKDSNKYKKLFGF